MRNGVEQGHMSWQKELMQNVTTLDELLEYFPMDLSPRERAAQEEIIEKFPMSIPRYYLSLIDRDDPEDPIRRLCVPSFGEFDLSGQADTSGEADNLVMTGLQHKYDQTTLILSTSVCAMYCRHCFRKRMVGATDQEVARRQDDIERYIRENRQVTNVLISGGDSFLISNARIEDYLRRFSDIDHLDFIRFGTRTPVVFPQRINGDGELLEILARYGRKKQILVVTQYDHPRELTEESVASIRRLQEAGCVIKNQSVLLKGVNDDPAVLAQLLKGLTRCGITPYYIFQCRPVIGVKNQFQVPLAQGARIVEQAKTLQNGQGKCFRYAMSHPTGKIEILGALPGGEMLFKYAQAKSERDHGRIFTMPPDETLCWLGDIPQ